MTKKKEYWLYSSIRGNIVGEAIGYKEARKAAHGFWFFVRKDHCTIARDPVYGRSVSFTT